jgi:hypothetical protein
VTSKLDSEGKLIDPSINDRLKQQVTGFAEFANRFAE